MAELAFVDDLKLFDGSYVRFHGYDGKRKVLCGVTAEALKRCDPHLPHTGLIPAEEFLKAFECLIVEIHNTARAKHAKGKFEQEGDIEVLIKRHDLLNY